MYRICIDARFYGITHTGIGRYVQNLVLNSPTTVILILSPENFILPELVNYKKFTAKYHPYSFLSQLEMFWLLVKIRPHLLHVPHFTIPILWPGKIIVTIHDLIKNYIRGSDTTTRSPLLYWPKYFVYLLLIKYSVFIAQHIIVPTNYWREIMIDKYHIPKQKISVTYEGIDPVFLKSIKNKKLKIKNSLVYTGNLYPHKNISVLITACENLKIQLSIICARSTFESRLKKSSYVHYLGKLSDTDIIRVYQKSLAFVTPSLIEGFGLTGLEAMASGLPVISSNATCLPEVYGNAALYFDPKNLTELTSCITKIQTDEKLRARLVSKGLSLVKKYSWAKMSEQTWQIYQTVLH